MMVGALIALAVYSGVKVARGVSKVSHKIVHVFKKDK